MNYAEHIASPFSAGNANNFNVGCMTSETGSGRNEFISRMDMRHLAWYDYELEEEGVSSDMSRFK